MKTYKIYMYDKKEDFKMYVHSFIIGGEKLKMLPALIEEEAGIFEEDKAKAFKNILNREKIDTNLIFDIEEVS